ncbi:MAG: Ni/Fe hydrogenase subunit alpha [Deltaproteobacteria bacterium]|nr:Ni/Fe hydrogenase subunit alpha [Deltaproteobacteria bacterium]
MKSIVIDPITRLEGHGKITIFLDEEGQVANTYFQIPELRGFEKFLEGRPIEEAPRIVPRICGVCPACHHMASGKAVDAVYHVEIPPVARKLRELFFMGEYIHSHVAHFYALAGPDFVLGPGSEKAKRHVLGIVEKVGLEIGGKVLTFRKHGHEIMRAVGGKCTHPVYNVPGGVSRPLTAEQRGEVERMSRECVELAKFTLGLFAKVVLENPAYMEIITGPVYQLDVHDMGLVDEKNRVNFYDGRVRVKDTKGNEIAKYAASEYLDVVAEHVEGYTYLKFPYLKKFGWTGFTEGAESGVYRATPLSRLNVADGMATPLAQEHYEAFVGTVGKPCKLTLATHWARLIELMYACERAVELATDPEILDPNVRTIPTATPTEGVGIVEAQRGTLTHHYATDERGIIRKANLIVGTTNNHAAITLQIKKAAGHLIRKGQAVSEQLLNMIEMAFRAYDPCFSCATHSLPGHLPMDVELVDASGRITDVVRRR